MNSKKIKAMMTEQGVKQVDIAKALRLHRGTVNNILNGRGTSRRVKLYVIGLLGEECRKYWEEAA
jgi:transcriptional regulator with XRE-family HTH domain